MRIAVIGGTGLIGTRLAARLSADGHDVVVAARATGVNSYTGEGLPEALAGVDTLVDVSNSGYVDEAGAREFFYGSTLNLLNYGAAAGVRHHVALSVVGTDRLAISEGGYFAAKAAQEELIRAGGRPHTIVHATQFFEFLPLIADAAIGHDAGRLSKVLIQPMAADDVAAAAAGVATGDPENRTIEFAGPERFRLDQVVHRTARARSGAQAVAFDPLARYFGRALSERELLPGPDATIASTTYGEWLEANGRAAHPPADGRTQAPQGQHPPQTQHPVVDSDDEAAFDTVLEDAAHSWPIDPSLTKIRKARR